MVTALIHMLFNQQRRKSMNMNRRYKTVETTILAWIQENERKALGWVSGTPLSPIKEEDKPYLPLTPLHSQDLYWDSQFVRAS